jgi:uncharacterized protein (TIGR04255 family)
MSRPPHLADFTNPPVVEVVLSIQFEPISGLISTDLGDVRTLYREAFPRVEEHEPLTPAFEVFGTRPALPEIRFEALSPQHLLPRLWFVAEDGSQLIQFQRDRLIHNWRKPRETNQAYPRYENIKPRFLDEIALLQQFMDRAGHGALQINQVEITYINHIQPPDLADAPSSAPEVVFNFWQAISMPRIEDVAFTIRSVIEDEGKKVGRVSVQCKPVITMADGRQVMRLELTARGKPRDSSRMAAGAFLDLGRDAIVTTFKAITTPKMHEIWGLKTPGSKG